MLAAALTVAAAAGLTGAVTASSAQASTLGWVSVDKGGAMDKQWSTAWNLLYADAYAACKRKYPRTVSIEMTTPMFYGGRAPFWARAYWYCRDTK